MHRRARPVALTLFATASLLAAACSGGGDDAPRPGPGVARAANIDTGGVLRLGVAGITSLDPAVQNPASPSQMIVADLLYDGLTRFDPTIGDVVGAVARGWTVSDGGLTWTFDLDPEARFSDGRPITATDVKASLERVVSLGIKSVTGVRLSVIDGYAEFVGNPAVGLRGLHVLDDHTLEVRLAAPLGTLDLLLSDPSFGIVPAGTSSDNAAFAGTPVGSGPFVVTSRTEDTITTERRDGSRAALSGITLRLFADTESAHAAFVVGELDMAVLASTDVASAEARGDLLLSAPHQVSTFYGMNVSSPVLSSPALRDAIVKAVDRDAIRREVFGNSADTMTGLLGPGVAGRRPDACGSTCGYDPDAARAILAQLYPGGDVPVVHVDHYVDDTGREAAIAQAIVDDLRAVGIPAEARAHTFEEYGALLTSGNAELFRFGWIGAYPSADAYLDPLFASNGSDNVFTVADADLDALLAAVRGEIDDAERTTASMNAEDRVLALYAVVPLVQHRSHLTATADVHGVVIGPDGTFDAERIFLA